MPKLAQKSFKKVYFRTSFTLDLQSYICYNNRVKASKKWSITGQYLNLEIRARKEVLRKIENAYKRLKKQAEANYEKRKAKAQGQVSIRALKKLTMLGDMTVLPSKNITKLLRYLSWVPSM